MSWFANAERRRAYKVIREIKTRASVVLLNPYGVEFEEPAAKLEECGYRRVKARPAYATDWKGGRA